MAKINGISADLQVGNFAEGKGSALTSTATITPTNKVHHVSGAAAITTIASGTASVGEELFLIFDGMASLATGGNIGSAVQALEGQVSHLVYDGAVWYPTAAGSVLSSALGSTGTNQGAALVGYRGVQNVQKAIDQGGFCPEMFGAAAIYDPTVNDQPFIQAAQAACEALGIRRLFFTRKQYAVWATQRTSTLDQEFATDGHPLVIQANALWESICGGTELVYFDYLGRDPIANWQLVKSTASAASPDSVWRGGALFILGQHSGTAQNPPVIDRVEIRGITFTGQRTRTSTYTNPANISTGDGWDLTDKGIWIQDTIVNKFRMADCFMQQFRGELYFIGGTGPVLAQFYNCTFQTTNGDAFNPGGFGRVEATNCNFGDSFQAMEALGGTGSRYTGCRIFNSIQTFLSGGPVPGFLYNYAYPVRDDSTTPPWIELDNFVAENVSQVNVASWIRGNVRTTDSVIDINAGNSDVQLNIEAWSDKASLTALSISGPSTLTTPVQGAPAGTYVAKTQSMHFALTCYRTALAIANNHICARPCDWIGYIDQASVSVVIKDGEANSYPQVAGGTPGLSMPYVGIQRLSVVGSDAATTGFACDSTTSNVIQPYSTTHNLYTDNDTSGVYPIVIGTAFPYADKQRLRLVAETGNSAVSYTFATSGAGVRLTAARSLTGRGSYIDLIFNAADNIWQEERFVQFA